jgi:hypothetical protein
MEAFEAVGVLQHGKETGEVHDLDRPARRLTEIAKLPGTSELTVLYSEYDADPGDSPEVSNAEAVAQRAKPQDLGHDGSSSLRHEDASLLAKATGIFGWAFFYTIFTRWNGSWRYN